MTPSNDDNDLPELISTKPDNLQLCGRCYDEVDALFDADCDEKPELQLHLGMYHCPDCGAMVLGRFPHPPICRPCLHRQHPSFDTVI